MTRLPWPIVVAALALGCACSSDSSSPPARTPAIVITDPAQRDAAAGKWVRVEGVVSNTKMPQIAGIDVDEPSDPIPGSSARQVHEVRGKRAWAEGFLVRTVIRPEDVDPTAANRGAGTFYQLRDPRTGEIAVAHPFAEPK